MDQRLSAWLAERLGADGVELGDDVTRPEGSGYSAETLMFDAVVDRGGEKTTERLVLRKETPDPAVYPQQVPGLDVEIEIQYRVMSAIAATSPVPLARLLGYEADPEVLGAPFFVMRHVAGQVPTENPIYTAAGFFAEAAPAQRDTMIRDGIGVMASIHAIDWKAAGLDWLVPDGAVPSAARQLQLWTDYAHRELDGRHHPVLERAIEWLHASLPAEPPPTLCWGDARLGNIIWRDFRAVCTTDFEAASIAPAALDVGWWLMFDRWSHDLAGGVRLDGEPSRDEQLEHYAVASGNEVPDADFYETFAAMRYGAIVVRVMNRNVARGVMPADQTIWLDNPVVTTLVSLLDGVGA